MVKSSGEEEEVDGSTQVPVFIAKRSFLQRSFLQKVKFARRYCGVIIKTYFSFSNLDFTHRFSSHQFRIMFSSFDLKPSKVCR